MNTGELITEIRRLAATHPNTKYNPEAEVCYYTKGPLKNSRLKKEGCIIGQAIRRVCPELFKKLEELEAAMDDPMEINTLIDEYSEYFPGWGRKQVTWLEEVQRVQDNKNSWSVAVETADTVGEE